MPIGFDKVTICNMALSNVGSESTIESIDEASVEARVCKLWYDTARYSTLEVYNWSFARKSGLLTTHDVAAPLNRWKYRYQWPADCVMPRLIENPAGKEADAVPFEVEDAGDDTSSIVTDMEQATLLYTHNLETTSRFSTHFVLMHSVKLGTLINFEITGKTSVYDRLVRRFNNLTVEAPATDASGEVPQKERDPVWIRDRN